MKGSYSAGSWLARNHLDLRPRRYLDEWRQRPPSRQPRAHDGQRGREPATIRGQHRQPETVSGTQVHREVACRPTGIQLAVDGPGLDRVFHDGRGRQIHAVGLHERGVRRGRRRQRAERGGRTSKGERPTTKLIRCLPKAIIRSESQDRRRKAFPAA